MGNIAVIDSGLGGLSVLRELRRELPHENFIYFGDSANAPYGDKSIEEIRVLGVGTLRRLGSMDVKCYVFACNTSTFAAVPYLREQFPKDPIVGIEPNVEDAVSENPGQQILVLATKATINGALLRGKTEKLKDRAELVLIPATRIVSFVEGGRTDSEEFMNYLQELIGAYKGSAKAVVLGCTHFPFVKKQIAAVLGEEIRFYDGAPITAANTRKTLEEKGLLSDTEAEGTIRFINSDETMIPAEEQLYASMG